MSSSAGTLCVQSARLRCRLQDAAGDVDHRTARGNIAQNYRHWRAVGERHIRDAHILADLRAAGRRCRRQSPFIMHRQTVSQKVISMISYLLSIQTP